MSLQSGPLVRLGHHGPPALPLPAPKRALPPPCGAAGSLVGRFSVTERCPKWANLIFCLKLRPISAPSSVPEPPSDGLGTPPGAGAVSRGPGSALDRAGCSGLAGFYRKPTALGWLHRMGWGWGLVFVCVCVCVSPWSASDRALGTTHAIGRKRCWGLELREIGSCKKA